MLHFLIQQTHQIYTSTFQSFDKNIPLESTTYLNCNSIVIVLAKSCNIVTVPLHRKLKKKKSYYKLNSKIQGMTLKSLTIIALGLISSAVAFSQEEKVDTLNVLDQRVTTIEDALSVNKKLTIGGYVQAQFEMTGKDGTTKIGLARNASETGNINRLGIRRTRLKVGYKSGFYSLQMEIDANATEFTMRDAFIKLTDPYLEIASLNVGIFNRPFGYEVGCSTPSVESAERSRVITTLFPDEKDQGAMITLQGQKNTFWNNIKLEAGIFGGNGYRIDLDNKKDIIGHLSYAATNSTFKYGFGVSVYDGFVSQMTKKIYTISDGAFVVDSTSSNKGEFAKRSYIGVDANVSVSSFLGLTSLRGEYITGKQPGTATITRSPISNTPYLGDTYLRNVSGGYIHLIQDIATTKHSISLKYDFYDPNTSVAGNQIGTSVAGKTSTNRADIAFQTIGIGYFYRFNSNIRLLVSYDHIINETSVALSEYAVNRNDDVTTVRVQYKF